jgi:hypothetical protein
MHSFSSLVARVLIDDLHRDARARARVASSRSAGPRAEPQPLVLTIRRGRADDAAALERLAALDSHSVPAEPVLMAEADGVLRAAVSLHDGGHVADPFFRTADIEAVLLERAAQLRDGGPAHARHRLPRLRRTTLASAR